MSTRLTEKQIVALDDTVKVANGYGVDIHSRHQFGIVYANELRPGRGHDIIAFYGDGEHIVQALIDVYGNGYGPAIGEVTWIHSGADEECDCAPCTQQRDLEYERADV